MRKHSLGERLRYSFDNAMSGGTISLIVWLTLIAMILVSLITAIVSSLGITEIAILEQFWEYMNLTIGADRDGGPSWPLRISTLAVTLISIFLTSTLIGLMTTGLTKKIEELRKGRSKVIEANHTVILGWSGKIFPILQELTLANENQKDACIIILSDRDKVQMEEAIRDFMGDTGTTRIICRRGNPMEINDLAIANLETCKSVIILAPDGTEDPDIGVIKRMLAVINDPDRRKEPFNVVTEIQKLENKEVAELVGKDEVEVILMKDIVARITAQTSHQSGLPAVYMELLSFEGNEIYFHEESELIGKTFGEAVLSYEDSVVIGIKPREKSPRLNPSRDTKIQAGDEIIAISEDDDTIILSELMNFQIKEDVLRTEVVRKEEKPKKMLIIGWNWSTPIIIHELDNYALPGATLTIVSDFIKSKQTIAVHCENLKNLTVDIQLGDTTDRTLLGSLKIEEYNNIILLSYSDFLEMHEADARTLITLLHLRDMSDKMGCNFSIVSEIMDSRSRDLVNAERADDFVISGQLISLIMAQVSENKHLAPILREMFSSDGSEVYFRPISEYIILGHSVNFYTLAEAALKRNQTAIGYRIAKDAKDPEKNYGVVVNPLKPESVIFTELDKLIILADD